MPPALFFFLGISLPIWDLFWFHINFRSGFLRGKKAIGILIGISLTLWMAFGSIDILIVLIFLIHSLCLPGLLLSMPSSFQGRYLSLSQLNLFLSMLLFLMQLQNGISFFSENLLLLCRNSFKFCMLILCPVTLLHLLVGVTGFWLSF